MIKYKLLMFAIFGFGLSAVGLTVQREQEGCMNFGPTLRLEYSARKLSNPVDAFMYFVPLNSLTAVRVQTDPNTNFTAGIVNRHHKDIRYDRFMLSCDFEITGSGLYEVVYDPDEMINLVKRGKRTPARLTGLLDWIRFDGPCQGRIEASGRMQGKEAVIEEVSISFNRDGQRSPVTIALYDVPRVDNAYDYANRQNDTIARVNTLTFRQSDDNPRMSVEIASVYRMHQEEGLFSSITAMFANLLLSAQPVSMVGNNTMMEFGRALFYKETEFTFPVAETLQPAFNKAQVAVF